MFSVQRLPAILLVDDITENMCQLREAVKDLGATYFAAKWERRTRDRARVLYHLNEKQ